eukprot:TRINITY_DN37555_c0_g1_i1.p1 TRINITY_DN37555_c0_g1~~TRINITY_DN37555_c0_g1_i1.p1  ORF type:complete len:498 (-),score=108.18 TRINITY_DN37555_c0_g1_i1:103-1596(-)
MEGLRQQFGCCFNLDLFCEAELSADEVSCDSDEYAIDDMEVPSPSENERGVPRLELAHPEPPIQIEEPSSLKAVGGAVSGAKAIVFVRHGESAGNAPAQGVWNEKSLFAYRDGKLTPDGERQVEARVALMDDALLASLLATEVVLVSPLARAMATAIILLAVAFSRAGKRAVPTRWPRVEVVAELREKVKSDSERPGAGGDALQYVWRVAVTYGRKFFGVDRALLPVFSCLASSYVAEQARTVRWQPEPADALAFISMIEEFKQRLWRRHEKHFLLVGHSGWARFAFSCFLPRSGPREDLLRNLTFGARSVFPLNNCGVIQAVFEDGRFRSAKVDTLTPGTAEFPNCCSRGAPGIFTNLEEARAAAVVPADGLFRRALALKRRRGWSSFGPRILYSLRLLTMSASRKVARLAWSSSYGKPLNFIRANGKLMEFELNDKDGLFGSYRTIVITDASEQHVPLVLRPCSTKNLRALIDLLTAYSNYGSSRNGDTAALASV